MMETNTEKKQIKKAPTGIKGLDEITFGGLPYGRPTLVSGYAGSGKTVLAMQFLLNGITMFNEPGVFVSLEETEDDLRKNMASLGYDLVQMEKENSLCIENIVLKHSLIHKSGQFDLSPLFIRIEEAIKKVGAKRIAIDTFELIFNDIHDENIFRQELLRLILWLKKLELTAVFTAESRNSKLHSGIEEFITDCVIILKHEMVDNIYTRRFHILKYRGSRHGTNEYPFLINQSGISVLPITSEEKHQISSDIISTGIKEFDDLIIQKGLYIGSTTLLSGTSGVGKTTFAVSFCCNALEKGKRCLFYTFEESELQLKRNMKSLMFDLEHYEKQNLLKIISSRPTLHGIETHLVEIYRQIEEINPEVVVFDPFSDLIQLGTKSEVRNMLLRIIDFMKNKLITILVTALIHSSSTENELRISSLVDNWIKLEPVKTGRNTVTGITIVKIRGMEHSRTENILLFKKKGLGIKPFNEQSIEQQKEKI